MRFLEVQQFLTWSHVNSKNNRDANSFYAENVTGQFLIMFYQQQ